MNKPNAEPPRYSKVFISATQFAAERHSGQFRKGTTIPYVSHLMAVAALVWEYGGDETQACAALLHDAIEDAGVTESELENLFGREVASIVTDCTDATETPKPPWRARKQKYISDIEHKAVAALLVSACDKLHNAKAIVRDIRQQGPDVWKKV